MANPISKLNLVINGVTTQLDVHDANALTTEIDSMGTDWVRFKSGLQICYGVVMNNNGIATGITRHSFPMAFIEKPSVVAAPNNTGLYFVTASPESATTWVQASISGYGSVQHTSDPLGSYYVAIGTWK